MPIKVTCRCGQQFAAKDELAGKVVKCPKCQESLKVGAPSANARQAEPAATASAATPSAVAALLDEVGFHVHGEKEDATVQRCPACDEKLSDHAVLCVNCGYNLETGKFVKGMGGVGPGGGTRRAEGHEGAALLLLKRAETAIEVDKDEERKIRTQGMPLWMLISILSMIATFTVGMSVLPADQAFMISGYVWMGVCSTLATFYWFWLLVIAFKESVLHGLMFQFVPFYAVYYVAKRWADHGKLFMIYLTLLILAPAGLILITLAPKMKREGSREVLMFLREPSVMALSAALDPDPAVHGGQTARGCESFSSTAINPLESRSPKTIPALRPDTG